MRFFRWLVIGFFLLVVAIAATLLGLYRASQSVPDFYQAALEFEPEEADKAGDQLEQQVIQLHNDVEQGASWELQLTDAQINGWLATDLPEKFPGLLPGEVEDPRVAFQDGMTHVACRLKTTKLNTVLSLVLDAYLTEQTNEIAIRIDKARAGLVPVPLKGVLESVATAAKQSGLQLRWTQDSGDPVALIQIPTDREDLRSGVVVQSMQIDEGKITVLGTADETSQSASRTSADRLESAR